MESGRKLKVHRSLSGKDRCNKKIDEDEAQLEEIWGLDEEINKEIDEAEFNSWLKENQIESYFKWLKERNKN